MNAVIVCNGSIKSYSFYKDFFERADFIICADGGARHLIKMGIVPHVLLGDFDSINQKDIEVFKNKNIEIIKFPTQKDMTDSELAVDVAIEKGCKSITIIGGIGSRLDHSLANIFLLRKMMDLGVKGYIFNENNSLQIIDHSIELERKEDYNITLLPLDSEVKGVSTQGLYYKLEDATIKTGSTWGVSNLFVSERAKISVKQGTLLVILSKDT